MPALPGSLHKVIMDNSYTELHLLETIYSKQDDKSPISQRDLAGAAGLSLGMTNALLRRFIERGWIKLLRLSGRSLRSILTTEGSEEVLRRSISYFSRANRSASLYRDKIDVFIRELARDGYRILVLEGPDELDFLFDYCSERHGLEFVKNPKGSRREALAALRGSMFVFTGATAEVCKDTASGASCCRLADILFSRGDPLHVAREFSS